MESHVTFNNLDYIIFGVIALSGLLALMRGFVREMLSLATLIGAYFVAAKFYPLVEPMVRPHIKNHAEATMAAAAILFVVALIAFMIVSFIIASFVRGKALTSIDRSLGFLFGLVRGVLVVLIIYVAAVALFWPNSEKFPAPADPSSTHERAELEAEARNKAPDWLIEARTYPALKAGAGHLRVFLPAKLEESTREYLDQHAPAAQKKLDDKTLEILSTPVPGTKPDAPASGYDTKSRDDLNNRLNEKVRP